MSKLSREMLDQKLDALAAAIPQLLADTRDECKMEAFAGMADEIREAAAPEDAAHVWGRLQCILREAGLIPGDDEACSERGDAALPDDDSVSQ